MPEWIWPIIVIAFMTLGYIVGYKLGEYRTDEAPTTNAWINVRRYNVDKQAEVEKYRIDKEHELDLKLMERGVFDNAPTEDEVE